MRNHWFSLISYRVLIKWTSRLIACCFTKVHKRTKSGRFHDHCFRDWLEKLAVPYFNPFSNLPRVIIGDDFASDLSADVIEICGKTKYACYFATKQYTPPSAHWRCCLWTAKTAWRKAFSERKPADGNFYMTLPKTLSKDTFSLLESMENEADYAIIANNWTSSNQTTQSAEWTDKDKRSYISPAPSKPFALWKTRGNEGRAC